MTWVRPAPGGPIQRRTGSLPHGPGSSCRVVAAAATSHRIPWCCSEHHRRSRAARQRGERLECVAPRKPRLRPVSTMPAGSAGLVAECRRATTAAPAQPSRHGVAGRRSRAPVCSVLVLCFPGLPSATSRGQQPTDPETERSLVAATGASGARREPKPAAVLCAASPPALWGKTGPLLAVRAWC